MEPTLGWAAGACGMPTFCVFGIMLTSVRTHRTTHAKLRARRDDETNSHRSIALLHCGTCTRRISCTRSAHTLTFNNRGRRIAHDRPSPSIVVAAACRHVHCQVQAIARSQSCLFCVHMRARVTNIPGTNDTRFSYLVARTEYLLAAATNRSAHLLRAGNKFRIDQLRALLAVTAGAGECIST